MRILLQVFYLSINIIHMIIYIIVFNELCRSINLIAISSLHIIKSKKIFYCTSYPLPMFIAKMKLKWNRFLWVKTACFVIDHLNETYKFCVSTASDEDVWIYQWNGNILQLYGNNDLEWYFITHKNYITHCCPRLHCFPLLYSTKILNQG